jgi:hypothetical protein
MNFEREEEKTKLEARPSVRSFVPCSGIEKHRVAQERMVKREAK